MGSSVAGFERVAVVEFVLEDFGERTPSTTIPGNDKAVTCQPNAQNNRLHRAVEAS
jgi:hypothetical protein